MRRSRRGSAEWPSSSTLTKADPPQVQQPKVQQEFPDWLMCGGDEEAVTGFANLLEFARINAAYEVLADPRRRRQYDDFGAKLQPGVGDGFAAMVQCMEPLVIGVGLGVITGVMYASELSMLRTVMYAISGFGLTAGCYSLREQNKAVERLNFQNVVYSIGLGQILGAVGGFVFALPFRLWLM
uniref:J domain-containing protein n=1 Tax=Pinguiococcus pyrenoidosus TaxID=172671 RepID=A0A7R9UDQ3_9STRA|mmetsp:Transcript_6085/g.23679  ORF Transcript_6085/g.23679 Transcript_6085/m.23679 type:complete len:183 (+) Transcript_6085:133-681(+)